MRASERPFLVTASAALAGALLVSACSAAAEPTSTSTDTVAAIAAGRNCGEVARPRLQQGSHLLGGAEPDVPYSSNPPTSGWHASGQPQLGVQLDGLSGPALVSALEAGHVVIAYDPDAIEESTQQRLVELATTTFVDRVTVTPWPAMPTAIALAGWGVLQRCHELDEDVLAGFVVSWFGESHRHE